MIRVSVYVKSRKTARQVRSNIHVLAVISLILKIVNTCTLALSRAWLLWEQFQKKSELFQENVLLVPHGDDFRYSDAREWEKQFLNLEKLMAYINSNIEMNTKVLHGFLFTL